MNELISVSQKQWPDKIMVNWRRLSSGLWRVPEGDISAAYCAETFPKLKVFTHEGTLFANCGTHFSGPVLTAANCYPLVLPEDYTGPEPRQYTYEGREARYKGHAFKLGPKVVFTTLDATVDEWRELFRAMYAEGGWFARQSNYELFLHEDRPLSNSENAKAALSLELSSDLIACSKSELKQFLDNAVTFSPGKSCQLDFILSG
jgi:hypothetical protein